MTAEQAPLTKEQFAEKLNQMINDLQCPEPGSWFDIHIAIRTAYAAALEQLAAAEARLDRELVHFWEGGKDGALCKKQPGYMSSIRLTRLVEDVVCKPCFDLLLAAALDARATLQEALATVREHIRLTREYVGKDVLPAIDGWSWYEAMKLIDRLAAEPDGISARAEMVRLKDHHRLAHPSCENERIARQALDGTDRSETDS